MILFPPRIPLGGMAEHWDNPHAAIGTRHIVVSRASAFRHALPVINSVGLNLPSAYPVVRRRFFFFFYKRNVFLLFNSIFLVISLKLNGVSLFSLAPIITSWP